MTDYTFYTLPISRGSEQFSPATLPSDDAAVAYAAAALKACDQTREVAIWRGWTFVAKVTKEHLESHD
ncbi:hypothetical protein [Brevundimonas diminuta]|uniref:hypothetical protein n=1 Tax=Brevundimonas diminuta TaxID=293 RepID=UPI0030F6D186